MEIVVPEGVISDIAISTQATTEALWPIFLMIFICYLGFFCVIRLIALAKETV